MCLGFGSILEGDREVREEVEARDLLDLVDRHILPLGAAVLVLQEVGSAGRGDGRPAGETHLHNALEVARGHCADDIVFIDRRRVTAVEDGARDYVERIAAAGGVSYLLDIALKRRPNPSVEPVELRRHVGEVGGLLGLLRGRPTVVGRDLMPAGIEDATLLLRVSARQVRLPGSRKCRVILPVVLACNLPRKSSRVHRKCHPQRAPLALIVEQGIIALGGIVVSKGVRDDFLGRGIRRGVGMPLRGSKGLVARAVTATDNAEVRYFIAAHIPTVADGVGHTGTQMHDLAYGFGAVLEGQHPLEVVVTISAQVTESRIERAVRAAGNRAGDRIVQRRFGHPVTEDGSRRAVGTVHECGRQSCP